MSKQIFTIQNQQDDKAKTTKAVSALESGCVLYFPELSFPLQQQDGDLLTESILDGVHKNVSYNAEKQRMGGIDDKLSHTETKDQLKSFMQRYADYAEHLVKQTLPEYEDALIWGRTSYRPAQVEGRVTSKRKDDTRLHVDAFPSTPVYGKRILRVFCNINPNGEARRWHLGESFPSLLQRLAPSLPKYHRLKAKILHWVRATKQVRSPYDHYMLYLHDTMKLDDGYQASIEKEAFEFPPYSTWMVFTDQVSHAALSGRHLLEQTFYLPVEAMENPEITPLKLLEKAISRPML